MNQNTLAVEGSDFSASAEKTTEVRNAGFWLRVVAMLIDMIILYIAAFVTMFPIAFVAALSMPSSSFEPVLELFGALLGLVGQWLYFTIAESSSWQATIGKKVLGLKVTDLNAIKIGFGRANARYWSKILSTIILSIGYIMVAFTQRKQGLHDIIADTLVVKKAK
jgi:uncharacterized RDD family membrane protein YckC